jgi:hypothetical protein
MTVGVGVVPCAVAVFVWRPGVDDATTGPTTQIVTSPAASGSVNAQDVESTSASVTFTAVRSTPPVLTIVNL